MLEGKAMVEDSDMPVKMQMQAMASASQALDLFDVVECKSIAGHIKKIWKWMAMCGGIKFWVFLHTFYRDFYLFSSGDTKVSHL